MPINDFQKIYRNFDEDGGSKALNGGLQRSLEGAQYIRYKCKCMIRNTSGCMAIWVVNAQFSLLMRQTRLRGWPGGAAAVPPPARICVCLVIRTHSFTYSPLVCIAWRQPCCPPWSAISNPTGLQFIRIPRVNCRSNFKLSKQQLSGTRMVFLPSVSVAPNRATARRHSFCSAFADGHREQKDWRF